MRALHSVKVKELYHNFSTTKPDSELYTSEDVDLIGYFMTVALLSCQHGSNVSKSPLEAGIVSRCST